jgi:hypothetical protein
VYPFGHGLHYTNFTSAVVECPTADSASITMHPVLGDNAEPVATICVKVRLSSHVSYTSSRYCHS